MTPANERKAKERQAKRDAGLVRVEVWVPKGTKPLIGWQPIETAPKDGENILLCRAWDADGRPIAPLGIFCQAAAWWGGEDGWVVYCDLVQEPRLHFEPTHWMPLPEPPVTKGDL